MVLSQVHGLLKGRVIPGAHLGLCQPSMMKLFTKIINGLSM